MISVPVYIRIWHKIGIDLIGPFLKTDKTPLSSMGYTYKQVHKIYYNKIEILFILYAIKFIINLLITLKINI